MENYHLIPEWKSGLELVFKT